MSSFKRRTPSKRATLPPGTRACPISASAVLTSSGIASLDDILGGGVPLSSSVTVLAPDPQTAYGDLVQKYFIAQGISNGHKVCVVHEDALSFVKECMWRSTTSRSGYPMPPMDKGDDAVQGGEKIKIAWRYEQMKKFETTVTEASADDFCDVFDLTCRIPTSVIDEACDAKRLVLVDLATDNDPASSMNGRMRQLERVLATTPTAEVVRLSVPDLGSAEWGDQCPRDILGFLCGLRHLLRRYPHGCACVSVAPHCCTDLWGGSGWVQKVGWVTDAAISVTGFGANPALTTLFPSRHGLVQIHKLPALHSVLPASDKYSTLRGLSSTAAVNMGAGENNIAFRCTRKRLIFETMHLGFEGGVAERRTMPSLSLDTGAVRTDGALAWVGVELEEAAKSHAGEGQSAKTRRAKKKVAFHTETGDVYDF